MNKNKNRAFTIVELLVIIVIIGVLATITFVSYSGISNQAITVSLRSDLESDAKLLKMYNAQYGSYPTALNINNCPSRPKVDTNYCLKVSSGNVLTYTGSRHAFTLINTNTRSQIAYQLTESGDISATTPPATPVASANLTWKQVSVGSFGACGISNDNYAYCWGRNTVGELGSKWIGNSNSPMEVTRGGALNGLTIKSIVSGNNHNCVIASDDNVYCWGNNVNGELGNNSTTNSNLPVAVDKSGVLSGLTAKSIVSGLDQVCIIASDDNAYCWGINTYGQLGNGTTTNSSVPVMVNKTGALSGLAIKSIAIGEEHTCVIASDDNAYCWGGNWSGQLGDNSTTNSTTPVAVVRNGALNGLTIKSIVSQGDHTCAIASNDNAYCWGTNTNGELGINSTTDSHVPAAVDRTGALSGLTIKSMTVGWLYTCAIASDNNAYCWGYNNSYGVLGNNSNVESHVPVAVERSGVLNGLILTSISGNYDHVCTLANDNNIYCWGENSSGQLGDGTIVTKMSPAPVETVVVSSPDETTNSPAATITFDSQELYIAYPGESQNRCKDYDAPMGKEIKGIYVNLATEYRYDNVIVYGDMAEIYSDSGVHNNHYIDISSAPASSIGICINTDSSIQDGFGAEITGIVTGDIYMPTPTITFSAQELYIAYPGESNTACKEWIVPNGYKIKGLYINQSTEQDYDYLTITLDGVQVYYKSGTFNNKFINLTSTPGDKIEACVSADESVQDGFGAEVTGILYE